MKVLTVVRDLSLGGTERVAVTCAIGYSRAGHDSAVLAYGGGGQRHGDLLTQGIQTFIGGNDQKMRRTATIRAAQWNPDIIHIHRTGYPDSLSSEVLSRLAGQHSKVVETNVFARFDASPEGRNIDLHLLLSPWCLWKYQQWSRRQKSKPVATVLPNPVDSTRFFPLSADERREARQRWGIPEGALVLGRIGRPVNSKWSAEIISEFEVIGRKYPNAYLLLVGAPEQYSAVSKRIESSVSERIKFLPPQSDDALLRSLYGTMDVFVHMSRVGESFGLVLCEAMLCGIPVVTVETPFKDNSQGEVVKNGCGGLVVRSNRHVRLAVDRLFEEPKLRSRLGQCGRERVLDLFEAKVVIPKLVELVDMVANSADHYELKRKVEELGDSYGGSSALEEGNVAGRTGAWARVIEKVGLYLIHLPELYYVWRTLKRTALVRVLVGTATANKP